MKKTLYSTTALAAAGLLTLGASNAFAQAAAPAAPEKMKIAVGGFHNQVISWSDQKDSFENAIGSGGRNGYQSFDQKSDTEVYFSGSVKLDNGMTVAVMVQLESDQNTVTAGTTFDESYMTVSGDFGAVKMGQTDFATLGISVAAPWTGAINAVNGDLAEFNVKPAANSVSGTCCDSTIGGADRNMVAYTSPSLAGFRVAGSYMPSSTDTNFENLKTDTSEYDAGIQWAGDLMGATVRGYFGYWNVRGSAVTADTNNYSYGADVKFGDFLVGAGYLDTKAANKTGASTSTSNPQAKTYDIGVKYSPAGYELGLKWAKRSMERTAAISDNDTRQQWQLGAKYNLGPGVDLLGTVVRDKYESESNNAAAENTAISVIGGIGVSF